MRSTAPSISGLYSYTPDKGLSAMHTPKCQVAATLPLWLGIDPNYHHNSCSIDDAVEEIVEHAQRCLDDEHSDRQILAEFLTEQFVALSRYLTSRRYDDCDDEY